MEISLNSRTVHGATVVEVRGEVDVYSSPTLRDRLTDLLDSGQRTVIVDLSEIGFLDSTGLGTLVAALKRADEFGAEVPLVCPQDRILKLFRITGLDAVFAIHASVDAALGSIHPTS